MELAYLLQSENSYSAYLERQPTTLHLRTLGHDQQTSAFFLYCASAMGLTVH